MDCLELSIKELKSECLNWSRQLKKQYQPDLIIYVAKAGYLIGKVMSKEFGVPLIGINAERKGNNVKSFFQPLFKFIPNKLRYLIIKIELKSDVHKKASERNIYFKDNLDNLDIGKIKNILIVDDSVDTGHSINAVRKVVEDKFKNVNIRIAALNTWDKSEEIIKIDYTLYKNTIIKAPMSKDSKEYKIFINMYNLAK